MIVKLKRVISCSSEHPDYPATNLLVYRSNSAWRTAKAGEMLATVIFETEEPSCIIGVDVGNYRCCVVVVTASTSDEPDKWVPIVNHQFMSHDDAADGRFKDQVQIFTKKELNPETMKVKFDRIKVTCMQSANTKTLFGLAFITFRTEVIVDLGLDAFGRFKMKRENDNSQTTVEQLKQKYLKHTDNKKTDYKTELLSKINENAQKNFEKKQEEMREPKKRPLLEKLEAGKADEVFSKPVARTPFGDIIPSPKDKRGATENRKARNTTDNSSNNDSSVSGKKEKLDMNHASSSQNKDNSFSKDISENEEPNTKKLKCCQSQDELCKVCNKLPKPKAEVKTSVTIKKKKGKLFNRLLDDVSFSLSGYVNPQRNEIRKKALAMGARYIADPNTTNNKCTHLICAFKNTPKANQLAGHCKIVKHIFIEDCYNKKKRFPWRRYAWDDSEKRQADSEDEIESIEPPQSDFDCETDSDSN